MFYETQASSGSASLADYYLQNGKGTHAYRYFGVHRLLDRPDWSYVFRVAAPGADRVSLVGEWDGWEPALMHRLEDSGVWELCVRADICPEGLRYKYLVKTKNRLHYKADPYARASESGGEGASVICTEEHYVWHDRAYLETREQLRGEQERYDFPMNVYEVELSGWQDRDRAGSDAGFRAIADLLCQYVADMGYTHVLLHSVCRQNAGREGIVSYFAPDSALGTQDDFAYFVDRMHKEQIGVIMELECRAPGTHVGGLVDFDGAGAFACMRDGRTHFDYADPYATTLLYSAAMFWLRELHLDGLYINTEGMQAGRQTGELIRNMSESVRRGVADALLILRASGYHGLSVEPALGGLGYDLIIDPRAERALLDIFSMPPELRLGRQAWREPARCLYAENSILALSSELILERASSVFGALDGTHAQKFAAMRLLYLFMACLPGKKMSFMGNEFAQLSAWTPRESVEWFVRELDSHKDFNRYVKALNALYLRTPSLWECDSTRYGLEAVTLENAPEGVIAFRRFDRAGREVCALINFGQQEATGVRIRLGGRYPYYEQIFSTGEQTDPLRLQTDADSCVTTNLPGLYGVLLAPQLPQSGFWIENA